MATQGGRWRSNIPTSHSPPQRRCVCAATAVHSHPVTRNGHRRAHPHEASKGRPASGCRGAPDRGVRAPLPRRGRPRVTCNGAASMGWLELAVTRNAPPTERCLAGELRDPFGASNSPLLALSSLRWPTSLPGRRPGERGDAGGSALNEVGRKRGVVLTRFDCGQTRTDCWRVK
jgi:hypothetical protein